MPNIGLHGELTAMSACLPQSEWRAGLHVRISYNYNAKYSIPRAELARLAADALYPWVYLCQGIRDHCQ